MNPIDLESVGRAAADLARRAELHDYDGADPASLCEPLVREGLFVTALSAGSGGRGGAVDATLAPVLARVLITLGSADLSAARLFEGHVNAIQLVARFGSEDQQSALSHDVRSGAVAGVWNAEGAPGLRLDPAPTPSTPGRLFGRKIYCSGLGLVSRPIVTARSPSGERVMLAPRRVEDVAYDLSAWTVQGMRASATGTADFTGLSVSLDEVVGGPGDYLRSPWFKGGAWRFAAAHAGATARLASLVRREVALRGRDGDPHQRARLGSLEIAAQTAELWVVKAASLAEGEDLRAEAIDAYVGLARTAVERAAMEAIAIAQRALGLSALTRPNPVERIARDLSTYLRQPFPDATLDEAAAFTVSCPGAPPWSLTPELEP